MNKKISAGEFHDSVERQLSGLKPDPLLARRIIASGGGEEPVKKKISASAIVVIALAVILATGALAATLNAWGVIDFAGNHAGTFVPADYQDSIRQENVALETESAACTIQESYYDGMILRLTARIVPKADALLIGPSSCADDPVSDLFLQLPEPGEEEDETEEEDAEPDGDGAEEETIGAYALRECAGRLAEVNLTADVPWEDCASDFMMNGDGSYTFYLECQFKEEQAEIKVPLQFRYLPMAVDETQEDTGHVRFDMADLETAQADMPFQSVETRTYLCETPLEFPGAGVRVIRVAMTATPLEIRCALDYEIMDLETYQSLEDGLWFEFIDPDSAETEYSAQVLSSGLTSGGEIGRPDGKDDEPDEVGTVYRQLDAIGLDNLGSHYTIRAYSAWEKTRFETVTFEVKEAQE